MYMAAASGQELQGRGSSAHSHSSSATHTPSFGSSLYAAEAASAPPLEAWPTAPASPWNFQAASVMGLAVAQSLQGAASFHTDQRLQEIDGGKSVRVENLHVHFHNQYAVGGIREEYEKYVRSTSSNISWPAGGGAGNQYSGDGSSSSSTDQPCFALASNAEGINFGHKIVKGFYRAVKHVDEHRNLITYTQSPSTAQSLSLTFTLGLSTKRAKHVIFVFDSGPPRHLAHAWPLHIHLRDVTSLIQSLGPSFEYTRSKVKKNRFSLYMFAIKQRGNRFSSQGMQTWAAISYWAHNLPDSADNATLSSFLSSLGSSQGSINF